MFLYFPCSCLSARRRFAEGAPLAGFRQYVSSSHQQKNGKNTSKTRFFAVFSLFFALSPRNHFTRTLPKTQFKTQLFVQPFLPEILFLFQNHSGRSPFGCYFFHPSGKISFLFVRTGPSSFCRFPIDFFRKIAYTISTRKGFLGIRMGVDGAPPASSVCTLWLRAWQPWYVRAE